MEAIILAGGLGTRLQPLISDIPKCMVSLSGKPFLQYLLKRLENNGFTSVILSLGYKHEAVETFISAYSSTMRIISVVEPTLLGTGGAARLALNIATEENVFILNGDTYTSVDYAEMMEMHHTRKADITIALKEVFESDRYGQVRIQSDNRITRFIEKTYFSKGLINTGVYIFERSILDDFPEKFSLEKDFFPQQVMSSSGKNIYGFLTDGYFIDIGIPEDYYTAQQELLKPDK